MCDLFIMWKVIVVRFVILIQYRGLTIFRNDYYQR